MSTTRAARLAVAATAVLLFWAGVAHQISKPTQPGDYRRTLIQVAATTHDAAGTGALVARQQLSGLVFAPFAATAYDDAASALAGAAKKLTAQPPPDDATAAMRDQLAVLLQQAVTSLGDATTADGDVARRAGADRLDRVAEELDRLLQQWDAA